VVRVDNVGVGRTATESPWGFHLSGAGRGRKVICSDRDSTRTETDIAMTAETPFLPETEVRDLITRAQRGDRAAFTRVIEQVRPFIYKLARQYSRRVGGAPVEDLVQTGLLAAVKSVPCFNTGAGVKFVSYVGVAARRAIHRAAFGWKTLPQAAADDADFIGELPDGRCTEITIQDTAETSNQVRTLIASHLGEREKRLIDKRFGLDGTPPQTYAELAVETSTSRQNVQQIVERALRRLRSAINTDVMNA
jgi:RNA polymerase sporulation-specific sigma factor